MSLKEALFRFEDRKYLRERVKDYKALPGASQWSQTGGVLQLLIWPLRSLLGKLGMTQAKKFLLLGLDAAGLCHFAHILRKDNISVVFLS